SRVTRSDSLPGMASAPPCRTPGSRAANTDAPAIATIHATIVHRRCVRAAPPGSTARSIARGSPGPVPGPDFTSALARDVYARPNHFPPARGGPFHEPAPGAGHAGRLARPDRADDQDLRRRPLDRLDREDDRRGA